MKVIVLIITLLSSGLLSYGHLSISSNILNNSGEYSNSQFNGQLLDEIPLSRKVRRMISLENGVYRLPFTKEHIREVVLSEINIQREILAPNFPDIRNVFNEEKEAILATWIASFPLEYDNFSLYLQTYLRSNRQ